MGSRTWVKLYCDKWLEGSIRDEAPEIRAIFIDLITLAGSGKYGDTGEIKLQNGVGFSTIQLIKLLKSSKYLLKKALKQLQNTGRISINDAGVMTIINWKKYQSEYERQKPYRNQKLQTTVTTNGYTGERERDRDKENVTRNTTGDKPWKVVN